ncbi:MAG: hypothetical protein ACR652_15980 [Methylocystis sp.]|uniref:hypothetical protein n=1 Tax=Methylocystis sp. TaxID=1911079 RepID=UPI003DA327C2
MSKSLLLASLIALGAASGAHAQIAAEHPRFCVMNVGPAQMMFSAFQENRTDAIFCQSIAEAGKTLIILDAKSNELRDMNIEARVLKDVGQKDWRDDLDANTVSRLPPGKYLAAAGTTSFNAEFAKDGEYMAVVRAFSDDGAKDYIGQYRFTVGADYTQIIATGVAVAAVSFTGFLLLWRRGSVGKAAAKAKPATSAARQSS